MLVIYLLTLCAVLEAGGLGGLLKLCTNPSDTVALMTVSALSLLLEDPSTHCAVIDGNKSALQRLVKLAASENLQVRLTRYDTAFYYYKRFNISLHYM